MIPAGSVAAGGRQVAALLQPGKGQAVAAANAGLLENVLEMNLDGTRADSKATSDLLVFEALLDQFRHLMFADGEIGAAGAVRFLGVLEHEIVHPGVSGSHHLQAL